MLDTTTTYSGVKELNRSLHFNYIEEKLNFLGYRIDARGKLNLLDMHVHSENFYLHFCNTLFGWQLENMNAIKQNAEAIDLIDHANKLVAQVSSTATRQKVESALSKDLSAYSGYTFKFISISKDAAALRDKAFANPHNLAFDPQADIHDIPSLLRHIGALHVDEQKRIAAFLKKELGTEVDPVKLESNLATIINILAKEDLGSHDTPPETIPFEIDNKIDFNDLHDSRDLIGDYHVYCGKVDRIYTDYDREGSSKSWSVLEAIRSFCRTHSRQLSGDALFDKVIECVTERILESPNFTPIPVEELEPCVNILVVDAFIRCKIFKNPVGCAHAAA